MVRRTLMLSFLMVLAPGLVSGSEQARLKENRARNLEHLRQYAETGAFPRNEHFPGELVPYFKDRHGNLCAVAYLMVQSGWSPVVDRVAAENNHVRIEDLTGGPVLDWIRTSGLTQAECALIQPGYEHLRKEPVAIFGLPEWKYRYVARIPMLNPHDLPLNFRLRSGDVPRIRTHLLAVYEALLTDTPTDRDPFAKSPRPPEGWEKTALHEKPKNEGITVRSTRSDPALARAYDPTWNPGRAPRIRMRFSRE